VVVGAVAALLLVYVVYSLLSKIASRGHLRGVAPGTGRSSAHIHTRSSNLPDDKQRAFADLEDQVYDESAPLVYQSNYGRNIDRGGSSRSLGYDPLR
jgi:hypothetical protein